MNKERIDVLVGSACEAESEVVGFLASQWGVPMVNYVSVTNAFEDKKTYDTLIMSGGNHKQTGDVIRKILAQMETELVCLYSPFQKGHLGFIEEGIVQYTETENITALRGFLYDFWSFGWNEEPKGSNGSRPSECDYRTPPSKLDTAPFWCAKPQPIRGFPAIEPTTFRRRQ